MSEDYCSFGRVILPEGSYAERRRLQAAKATNDPAGRVLEIDCADHGALWATAVYCTHDSEAEMQKVANAHSATYGAACAALLTVRLTSPEEAR